MPTGSGKTAVLVGSAFLLRARRALVITPSRIVREQIVEEFKMLRTLKMLAAIEPGSPTPAVQAITNTVQAEAEWAGLSQFDVIVSLPNSISPGIEGVSGPPNDFFDVVLVDEAHHGPAPMWQALLERVGSAKQVHFTATPFRRDEQEIAGKLVYVYQLRDAYRDGIFGQLEYRAVSPDPGDDPDHAIARAASRKLRADRQGGFDHCLMVRTGTKVRARNLLHLYTHECGLRLNLVTGDRSLKYLRNTIDQLRSGELDGIVCVDMLGEGFDLPNLKIAALHTPHKSLAVTLQFIGRFARTTAPNLGPANFFALASDMEIERVKLYREGAAWEEIIPNLSGRRVEQEENVREVLATFVNVDENEPDEVDLSLHSLKPFHHVKVFNVGPDVDIGRDIDFPSGMDVVHKHFSAEHSTAVYVVRREIRPEWTTTRAFDTEDFHLVINYYDRPSELLFICSSLRSEGLYEHIGLQYIENGRLRAPSLKRLNRVLLDLEQPRFYNIGMRKSVLGDNSEAYRIIAGSNASEAIDQTAGRTFRRGHWYGSAMSHGESVTVGLSSSAKIWSNETTHIPELIEWCRQIAAKITSNRDVRTHSGLDLLSTGEEITSIPENIAFVDWNQDTYLQPIAARYSDGHRVVNTQLLDLDLRIDFERSNPHQITILVSDSMVQYRAEFSFETERFINPNNENEVEILVDESEMLLENYLNLYLPAFFTADLASFEGNSSFPPIELDGAFFNPDQFDVVDWEAAGVDVLREFGPRSEHGRSVHEYIQDTLTQSEADIVIYDHGPGEIADFLSITALADEVKVALYHCKASGGRNAAERLSDAYEVVGQAIKCVRWGKPRVLTERISARLQRPGGGTRLLKGDQNALALALNPNGRRRITFESVIVQPGFSRAELGDRVGPLLAAADGFLFEYPPFKRLRVMGSA